MKIQVATSMKAKANTSSSQVTTSSIRACSFAMDDGGRCLLDVINDPLLLQSFLESGSDDNSKDPQDGTSSESAVESPQVPRSSNHLSVGDHHIAESSEAMGFSYAVDQGLLAQSGGMSFVMAPSTTYQHASSSGATIHHVPSTVAHTAIHSPARSITPHNIKSPGSSVMPPPSPLQQTRSPLPTHAPSPVPSWSPAPPVLSPSTSRQQQPCVTVPSVAAFQQSHNQILQTSCSVTQFVTALATQQQSITQKLTLQQQQQLFLHQQLSPAASQQSSSRLTAVNSPVVTTAAVTVTPPMVQLISAPPSNVPLPVRTSHSTVRPIQPKQPPQILPKPAVGTTTSQFATPSPAAKQTNQTPVTSGQRSVGVGLTQGATGQLVIGQGQPGVFSGPQGTILLNQIIPGVGQSPILIQGNLGNLGNLQGLQLTLRPPGSVSPAGQQLSSSNSQNNATLIAALQGPSQHAQATTLFAQTKSPLHHGQQQTIVIPNHAGSLTPQNLIQGGSQQGFLARSNIFLSSPRMMGPSHGLQLQQIQTPQGPILAFAPAVPHLQQMAPLQLSLQSHGAPSTLQFGTAMPTYTSHLEQASHQVIQVPHTIAAAAPTQQVQLELSSPKSPPKKSLNLEELLKEHGIVPDGNSPPPSPDSNLLEESHHLTAANLHSQQQQLVLEELSQSPQAHSSLPQLKLALTQDGSVILQPHTAFTNHPAARVQHYVSSGQLHGHHSAVLLPTVTTTTSSASVPVVAATTESPSTARGHSALLARLNASPAICVPDVVALSSMKNATTSPTIVTTTIATTTSSVLPVVTSSYIIQKSVTVPTLSERTYRTNTESGTVVHSPNPVAVTNSACVTQQNRVNHVSSECYQAIVVSKDGAAAARTVSATPSVVTTNSQSTVQVKVEKCSDKHVIEIADNNGAVVPSHNLSAISSGVPNHVLQKLQKEISELLTLKYRSLEQQRALQELMAIQQKITMQPKGKGGSRTQTHHLQIKRELEILEKLIQRPSLVSRTEPEAALHQVQDKNTAQHSVQLVNLLKQSPPRKPNIAVVPTTATVCDSTTTTASAIACSVQSSRVVSQPTIPVPQPQSILEQTQPPVTVPAPVCPSNNSSSSSTCPLKGTSPVSRVKNTIPTAVLLNDRLTRDQGEAVEPDVLTPFASKADACRRLLKYHVFNSKVPSIVEIRKADETFDMVSVQLLEKVQRLKNKYHLLQLKESMRICPTPERVYMERLFLEDEQAALEEDRANAAARQQQAKTLSTPPLPGSWRKEADGCRPKQKAAGYKSESSCLLRQSDEEASSDHLEAPVIDSCADIAVDPHDESDCDRSPPTLKRIVIKPERLSESDSEECYSRKRLKFNAGGVKAEADWDGLFLKDVSIKKEEEDIMSKIRKELNMSPMEMDDEDFEPPNGTADFEPPVARTEAAPYHQQVKYDFDMLVGPSEWTEAYRVTNHDTDAAVESILEDPPSELDLSGLEGLDDHLTDEGRTHIPNGIEEYRVPKPKRYHQDSDQVQTAIKSILDDERSYLGGAEEMAYEGGSAKARSLDVERDAALDEAVRSILL